jgi:uncharacterized surface protein with fasciclin (FAS1) repeats
MKLVQAIRASVLALAASSLTFVAAQAEDRFFVSLSESAAEAPANVLAAAAQQQNFSGFLALVRAAGYESYLREHEVTVFAPTDVAFADSRDLRRLTEAGNEAQARQTLERLIVPQLLTRDSVSGIVEVRTLAGTELTLDGRDGLRVEGVLVAVQDVPASHGVLQGVNANIAAAPGRPALVASR